MDIHDAIEEFLGSKQNSITHSTYVWYSRFLSYFDDWTSQHKLTDLTQISAIHVQQFVSACPTINTNTRHARAQIVKGFLSWCSQDEEMGVKERTVKRIEMPKLIQSEVTLFTDGEIIRLFRACDKMKNPHRNRAIVHMLLDTGIRAAELSYDGERVDEETGLKMECLVLGRGGESFIWVMGKGQKARTVGLGNETTMALRKYLNRERGRSDSPYVFLARGDEPLSVRMLQQFLDRLGELADVENTHPHRFRHTFAVNQLMNGTSDLVLMRLMGHTTLDSTKIYTRAMTQLQARKAAPSIVDRIKSGKGNIK
jgi:site-specific recombinase XerD